MTPADQIRKVRGRWWSNGLQLFDPDGLLPFFPLCSDVPISIRSLFHSVPQDLPSSSAMDPITTFSLVCGVVQIVDTSMEVAKKCRELYKHGASSEDREIEIMASRLTDLYGNLDLRAQDTPGGIQDLCSNCANTAQQLCTEVQKLKVYGPHRKREAVVKTVKAVWKKSAIEDIQEKLDGYQKVLDSNILVDLRCVTHQRLFPFRDELA